MPRPLVTLSTGFRTGVLSLLSSIAFSNFSAAQSPQIIRFNGGSSDHATSIAVDAAGSLFVGGSTIDPAQPVDFAVVKHTAQGAVQWVARYHGTPDQIDGFASSVVTDAAGNVYAGGYIARQLPFNQYAIDWLVVSFDANGAQRWAHVLSTDGYEQVTRLALDSSGALYATGIAATGNDFNWLTVKYSTNGNVLWQRTKSGAVADGDDRPQTLRVAPDGGVAVLGLTANGAMNFTKDISVVRYDAQGNLLWERNYSDTATSDEIAGDLAIDPSGNVYVTGATAASSSAEDANTPVTLKYDANGNLLFTLRSETAGGNSIAFAPDGNLVLSGSATGEVGAFIHPFVTKITLQGNQLWSTALESSGEVAVDTDGSVYVGGTRGNSSGFTFFATKLSASGQKLWDQPIGDGGIANDALLDAAGNFYVTGDSRSSPSDMLTVKFPRGFTPPTGPTSPAAPTNLSLGATKGKLTLQWADNSNNETGFRVERSINGGAFAEIAVTVANARMFTDSGLNKRNTYAYRVRATNSAGNSAYSNTATGSPQ